jgi:PAS domain S-box-containing protein
MLLVSMGVMFLFTLLDYLLVPEHFSQFFRYRLFAIVCTGLLLAINFHDQHQRRAWAIGFAGYLCIGIVVLLIAHQMGAINSPYYVGLIVAITIYTALTPLTAGQTLFSGLTLVCLYLLAIIFTEPLSQYELTSLFSNLFFMVCFVFIAATQSWADTSARRREWMLRSKENSVASALARQAEHLENEVKKRAEAQKVSEKKYRLLYQAIVDDVVLMTREGKILQANASYRQHFHDSHLPPEASFFDAVRPEDRQLVQTALLDVLARGEPVSAWQWTLIAASKTPLEVEISGALLQRAGKPLGLQLVIRDISIRRQLESTLITSLQRCQQMENAAILALAKLSEYHDVTPGHHLERIREYCRILADELARHEPFRNQITQEFKQNLYQGAILHDIGKVGVADTILGKKSRLTHSEEETLRHHPRIGGDMIKAMEKEARGSSFLSLAKNIAYFHHERWDGTGYPYGIRGVEIPLEARIMALADGYEALTAALDPKQMLLHRQAVQRIVASAGRRFDPAVVEAFVLRQMDFDKIRDNFSETQ